MAQDARDARTHVLFFMKTSPFQIFAVAVVALLFDTDLNAQTARPGGNARGTTGTTNRGNTGNVSGGNSRSSTGGARQYRSNTELGDATIQVDPETRSIVMEPYDFYKDLNR